jgi:Bax protein
MHSSSPFAPTPRWRVALEALPLITLLALLLWWWVSPSRTETEPARLSPLTAESALAVELAFDDAGYAWPPNGPIPRLALQQLPLDLAELPVANRKSLFFSSLTPLVLAENERLRRKRTHLEHLLSRPYRSAAEQRELAALAERYGVTGDLDDPQTQERLLRRVDEVPLGLALAQAAKESGWGTSRFAREARNLFGVWTWDQSQGLIPAERQAGATHLVRVFPNLQASVRNYLHTLNTGAAYAPLRQQRQQLRETGAPLHPLALVQGLERYSERGSAYVREVRAMILSNQLHQLGELTLKP